MKSMTGYGLGKSQSSKCTFEISIRAVNGRFLETRFHLPRELFAVESELKKILQKFFSRGTVDVFVSRKSRPGEAGGQIKVNKALAKQYMDAYKSLATQLKIKTEIHVEVIARLPEVIQVDDVTDLGTDEKKQVLLAMTKACEAADKERRREGKVLRDELEVLLTDLDKLVLEVQTMREEANHGLQQKFEQKIKSRLSSMEIDSTRLSQEVVIQLEKSDINEELSRLKEHLRNYHGLLIVDDAIGKKLDFYTQELLREVNTIGSKSSLSHLTSVVVQAKTLIERVREQVQNVE